MKKHLIIVPLFILAFTQYHHVFGQTLAEQNKKLQQEIETLKHDNDYFRKTLAIFQSSLKTESIDSMDFQLLSCIGSKVEKNVKLEFLITNKETDKSINFSPDSYARGVDLQGNAYKPSGSKIGTDVYASTINKDVPLKFVFQFKDVEPSVAVFKLISVKYYLPSANYKNGELQFKDISVVWK
ncbi:hypothetical protein [uncultured Chitinophaga sp.]|uniref:hypothetical protein n=1 Tax=uncultured Chitinophaga sp. TaxID=339340 RepID=UPI0025E0AAE5|nr:hypothetical protein [uncultured Chitinophaga sp.]